MLGITLSHPYLTALDLNINSALKTAFSFNFSHLRLGSYWSEVETQPNKYDFSQLLKILDQCQTAQQPVVMTLGVKAPRWPEFYWPSYLKTHDLEQKLVQDRLLKFVSESLNVFKKYSCITHWQVENEPLDPSGPQKQKIPFELLKKEVALVRSLDQRPIIINLWGNHLLRRGFFPQVEKLADIIGLDLYPKQFFTQIFGHSFYLGPGQSKLKLKKFLSKSKRPIWITELQAEPWEKNQTAYFSKNPGSLNLQQLEENLSLAQNLPVEEILLWGFEYWLWQQEARENDQYLKLIKKHVIL